MGVAAGAIAGCAFRPYLVAPIHAITGADFDCGKVRKEDTVDVARPVAALDDNPLAEAAAIPACYHHLAAEGGVDRRAATRTDVRAGVVVQATDRHRH